VPKENPIDEAHCVIFTMLFDVVFVLYSKKQALFLETLTKRHWLNCC